MKIFLLLIICSILFLLVYNIVTKIRFENYRGKIGSMYCRFAATKNLPVDPIIFIPGIKGSTLEKDGQTIWLKLSQAIFSESSLEYTGVSDTKATGIFTGLTVIPFLLEYKPYYKISEDLSCTPNSYFFYYDWRDYPDTNSRLFGELVERVMKETGKKPSIIAHSMGGLIAHGYIKEHPENIDRVVYVSVPFQPGVGYFDDVNEGISTGLNKKLLSKEVLFSHPASYLLMPHKGSGKYAGKELMEAKIWSDNKFSIFKDSTTDLDNFQQTLDKVASYHARLDNPKTLSNKFLFVVGKCHPTVLTINTDGKRSYVPGDGRVSEVSAYPVDNLTNKKVETFCQTHDQQMNDMGIIKSIFKFLNSD